LVNYSAWLYQRPVA